MSEFLGYLLKFGDTKLPNKYISYQSFKVSPDQRLEIEAYRDANSLLHRVTSTNFKSKIEFNTLGNLNLKDKEDIFAIISKGLVNDTQKKYYIEYWNDDRNSYRTGYFYTPNIEYTIRTITEDGTNSNIIYEPIRIAFIEY